MTSATTTPLDSARLAVRLSSTPAILTRSLARVEWHLRTCNCFARVTPCAGTVRNFGITEKPLVETQNSTATRRKHFTRCHRTKLMSV
jgi:hypothetical protein